MERFSKLSVGFPAVIFALSTAVAALAWPGRADAQWPPYPDPTAPRDADGNVIMDAPPPRTEAGTPDLSGLWMRTQSGPRNGERRSQDGGAPIDVVTAPVPIDPEGPPIAAFFEAGQNMEGGLPYTP